MSIRNQIESIFQDKAFDRPLFYAYEGGLRFELSEGGSYIEQFITANQKANEIAQVIFSDQESISICLKFYGDISLLSSLSVFRKLKELDISIPKNSEHWSEPDEDDDDSLWHYVAFSAPKETLRSLLWCACASDFGYIKPNPGVIVYLFNFEKEVIVFPYDDRGMDVVGNNHDFLKSVYSQFNEYQLDYDRATMEATFA